MIRLIFEQDQFVRFKKGSGMDFPFRGFYFQLKKPNMEKKLNLPSRCITIARASEKG